MVGQYIQLVGVTFVGPLERGEAIGMRGLLQACSLALATMTSAGVNGAIGNSEIPEYELVGKRQDRTTIARLAAYFAQWLEHRFIEDHPEVYSVGGTRNATSEAIIRDFTRVREIMYPPDHAVTEAMERSREIQEAFFQDGNSFRWVTDSTAIIDGLLGVSAAGLEETVRRSIVMTGPLAASRTGMIGAVDKFMIDVRAK